MKQDEEKLDETHKFRQMHPKKDKTLLLMVSVNVLSFIVKCYSPSSELSVFITKHAGGNGSMSIVFGGHLF